METPTGDFPPPLDMGLAWSEKALAIQERAGQMIDFEKRISALEAKDAEQREWLSAVMHGTQKPHEPPKPEAQWNVGPGRIALCRYISDTPALTSLLYDLDLLPEQCKPGTREAFLMIMIAQAWKINGEAVTAPLLAAHQRELADMQTAIQAAIDRVDKVETQWRDAKTDPPKQSGDYIAIQRNYPMEIYQFCHDSGEWHQSHSVIPSGEITHWTALPPPP